MIDVTKPIDEQLKNWAAYSKMLESLQQQPGWEVFQKYMIQEEARVYESLNKCGTGDLAMKAVGAYTAIKNMREWASNEFIKAQSVLREYGSGAASHIKK